MRFIVGVCGLIVLVCAAGAAAAPAPRVETFDDGSAAVTLKGGLTVVLDRTVTRDVRARRGEGSLDQVIDRHARGDRARARAIRVYARKRADPRRARQDVDGRAQPAARAQSRAPADGAARAQGTAPLTRARPLGAGLRADGRGAARRSARGLDRVRQSRPRDRRRPGAERRPSAAAERSGDGVRRSANRRQVRRSAPRGRSPARRLRGRQARPVAATTPRRPRQRQPRRSDAAVAGTGTRAPRLPDPAGSLLSSSLSTTVVGPDPVASPSGLTLR